MKNKTFCINCKNYRRFGFGSGQVCIEVGISPVTGESFYRRCKYRVNNKYFNCEHYVSKTINSENENGQLSMPEEN